MVSTQSAYFPNGLNPLIWHGPNALVQIPCSPDYAGRINDRIHCNELAHLDHLTNPMALKNAIEGDVFLYTVALQLANKLQHNTTTNVQVISSFFFCSSYLEFNKILCTNF